MKAYHVLCVGDAGGGKTTKAREWHATADACSVYMTSKGRESNVAGRPANGRQALDTAVSQASSSTDVRAKWFGADYPADVATVRAWAHDVRTHRGWSTQVIVDEAHGALPDGEGTSGPASGNPLRNGLHEDRDQGIKYVLVSQDPSDLYYPPLKQCRWVVWVGPPSPFHEGFARYFGLKDQELPAEDFEYVVFEKGGAGFDWDLKHRGETDRRYA